MAVRKTRSYSVAAACKLTKLSEKKIRRYIEEGMIHDPLTEADLTRLSDYQWLESHVLGTDKIRDILNHPFWIPGQPELGYQRVILEMNRQEQEDARRFTRVFKYLLLVGLLLILLWFTYGLGFAGFFSFTAVILLFLALVYGFIALTYYQESHMALGSFTHVTGQVVSIIEDHGTRATRIKAGSNWLADAEPANSGAWWHLILMIVYEFRTDCWYPVIEFWNDDGMLVHGLLHYSGWKDTWRTGRNIEVSWRGTNTDDLYPTSSEFVIQKMNIFIFKAALCLGIAIVLILVVQILNLK